MTPLFNKFKVFKLFLAIAWLCSCHRFIVVAGSSSSSWQTSSNSIASSDGSDVRSYQTTADERHSQELVKNENWNASQEGEYLQACENSLTAKTSDVSDSVTSLGTVDSQRQILRFAIPVLGIYLTNSLLSNIVNAFVGQTVGTHGLAAMSPATMCIDQIIYLFSFLPRATTGLVSRGYGTAENTDAAREAGGPPLTVAVVGGFLLSIFYATSTPKLLEKLHVQSALRKSAASYIYWRGAVTWAALAQSVSLSILLATRDVITPLKIIVSVGIFQVICDSLLCIWPLKWGCAGVAAANSFSTLLSCSLMIKALHKKQLLPNIFRVPSKAQFFDLLEFIGPLMVVTLTRVVGFMNMQQTAMKLGLQELAAYQMIINMVVFFVLFGEPLSQLSQTKLPALLDATKHSIRIHDSSDKTSEICAQIQATTKSIFKLGVWTSLGIGTLAYGTLLFGSKLFASDTTVIELAKNSAPSVFVAVACTIFSVMVDGTLLASRDFGLMLVTGVTTMIMQYMMLNSCWCTSLSHIFLTFAFRWGGNATVTTVQILLGRGTLGRAVRRQLPQSHKDTKCNQVNGEKIL